MALLFVYGTLMRRYRKQQADDTLAELEQALVNDARWLGEATTEGSLYQVAHYPGLVCEGEGTVQGELYEVSDDLLLKLDDYEGCGVHSRVSHEYRREIVRVQYYVSNSLPMVSTEAWAYVYQGAITPEARIASGCFLSA